MTDTHDIAVVGAGLTGSALAVQLARCLRAGARVLLLGAPGETARGIAYSTKSPEHLLNVRAGRMSLIRDDTDHFVRWLVQDRRGELAGDPGQDYAPRTSYGRYVDDTLREAIAGSAAVTTVVEEKATRVLLEGQGFVIATAGGSSFRAGAVVLCIGHGPLSFPLPVGSIPREAGERMIADPWTDPRMATIAPDARILFVGSSQTMADHAVGLAAAGHRGPMVAVSRHGQLPATQLRHQTEPFSVPVNGPSLLGLFKGIVEAGSAEARAGRDWRAVIDGLRPRSQALWEGLSLEERRRFIRHAEAAWLVHRSRLAPAVGERIEALQAEGRLTIRAGRLAAVAPVHDAISAGVRPRGEGRIRFETFDWIINCSGVGRLRPDAMEPLLAQMLAGGIVRPHQLGRGLEILGDYTAIDLNGAPVTGLFVLGPLAGGHFFESVAVPEIAEQCAHLAQRLADTSP